jgi:hypothetical protein
MMSPQISRAIIGTNQQLKVEEFERNKQYNDLYEKTNHQVRQEALERTLAYNKL